MLFKRTLITGANGMLGQALVSLLGRFPEYDVLATGRESAQRVVGGSGGYVPMDICDYDAVRAIFSDFSPGVVVNCAAMTGVDACENDRESCWRTNVDAVEHLAKCSLASGARLLQVSTDFVFDGENGPYSESDRPNPVNFYGKSKLAAENFVRGAGLDRWAIVRTVLVYGTGERLGRQNIALWVRDRLIAGETIRVVTDQYRTPTYVEDLARGIERVVRFGKSGVFHVSGREMMSVHEFATRVARVFGLDSSLVEATDSTKFRQPAARPLKTGFIILKAETELGYKPHPVDAALRELRRSVEAATPPVH